MHPECINRVKPVTRAFTKLNKQSIQGEPAKVVSHGRLRPSRKTGAKGKGSQMTTKFN